MARIMELFVIVNAMAGVATFLGVRFVWRRSKDKAKRGLDIIHTDKEECPVCHLKYQEDEIHNHLLTEHPEVVNALGEYVYNGSEQRSGSPQQRSLSQ